MTITTPPSATRRIRAVTIRKWVVIGVLAVALLVVVGWLILPSLFTSQATRDARDVFCLQPGQRQALAEAAVALGIANDTSSAKLIVSGGTSSPPPSWRQEKPDDFTRTCDALAGAQGKPATQAGGVGGPAAVILPLLTAVLSAALAYASTRRQNAATVGQADAKELRELVTAYRDAANKLLDAWKKPPVESSATAETDAARDALAGRLNALAERKPGWTRVAEALTLLRTGDLRPGFDRDLRTSGNRADRVERIDHLRKQVVVVTDTGFSVADTLASGDDSALVQPPRTVVAP
ncbi:MULTISPECIES: hypothetical protein [unclassified Amycolatopsis]|uniref:hypothetical protein n=1 Tax=unclassified Amycolatopsis TaxID=2618356 RepID=UPI00287468BE|nr:MULTISPECIES: hypothetical protein [unclassified Amycolatopsis]MDS0135348.1 hypothetical protein [Amycolatopsis sp. 505]MDS0140961.1 hypothetical protein [Amycolatopsis sp. CM201R]